MSRPNHAIVIPCLNQVVLYLRRETEQCQELGYSRSAQFEFSRKLSMSPCLTAFKH
jgi:hypothetical protein